MKKRTFNYERGKRVYYFSQRRNKLCSGTIYKPYRPHAGETYLIEPDQEYITEGEKKYNAYIKQYRKKRFNEEWEEPITHLSVINFTRTYTERGLESLKTAIISFLTSTFENKKKVFRSVVIDTISPSWK